MIRRIQIIGILVAGLIVTMATTSPASCRLLCSAQNVRQYFQELNSAGDSLNPIERLVFSLVMANSKPAPAKTPGHHS